MGFYNTWRVSTRARQVVQQDNLCKFNKELLRRRLRKEGLDEKSISFALSSIPDNYRCSRRIHKNGFCEFHSIEKPDNFESQLEEEIKRMNKDCRFKSIDFTGFVFEQDVDFSRYHFSKQIIFRGCIFYGKVEMRGMDLNVAAYFDGCIFRKGAHFEGVNFKRWLTFRGSIFCKGVSFSGATTFHGTTYLEFKLKGLANFSNSTFKGPVSLNIELDKDATLIFYMVSFKEPRKVTLTGFPLTKVSFLQTDVIDVNLVPRGRMGAILDEKLLKVKEGKISFNLLKDSEKIAYRKISKGLARELVIAEYKVIRKCLESNRMFTEASDLFIREMKMSRERLGINQLPEMIAHYIYDCVASYGESVGRPVLWAFLTVLFSALCLEVMQGSLFDTLSGLLMALMQGDIIKFLYTLFRFLLIPISVFLQVRSLRDFNIAMSPEGLLLEIVVRVLSVIIVGSLFISLRRKLERR